MKEYQRLKKLEYRRLPDLPESLPNVDSLHGHGVKVGDVLQHLGVLGEQLCECVAPHLNDSWSLQNNFGYLAIGDRVFSHMTRTNAKFCPQVATSHFTLLRRNSVQCTVYM